MRKVLRIIITCGIVILYASGIFVGNYKLYDLLPDPQLLIFADVFLISILICSILKKLKNYANERILKIILVIWPSSFITFLIIMIMIHPIDHWVVLIIPVLLFFVMFGTVFVVFAFGTFLILDKLWSLITLKIKFLLQNRTSNEKAD
jgi:hypothetical protein